jgi:hypothetical protein
MKITNCPIRLNLLTIAILVLVIFIIKPVKAQNLKQEGRTKTMKIKVVKEKDGKKTVFDTTVYTDNSMNQEEIVEMIKNLKSDMKELEMQLKNLSSDYNMKVLDSLELDSLAEGLEKIIVIGDCGKNGKLDMHCMPNGYKYNFDIDTDFPNMPDCPMMWQDFDNEEFNFRFPAPANVFPGFNEESEAGSLDELLGKIPMERVKSYSIKDRKNGKRIIIDVENGPMFEPKTSHITRPVPPRPTRKGYHHGSSQHDVKVIIKTDTDEGIKYQNEEPVPEKVAPKDSGKEKKTKI